MWVGQDVWAYPFSRIVKFIHREINQSSVVPIRRSFYRQSEPNLLVPELPPTPNGLAG